MPKDLDAKEIASTLGVSASANLPSGRPFNEVFDNTARWLLDQRYIQAYGSNAERAVLTHKAFIAMNVVPPTLGRSRGSELVDATREAKSVAHCARDVRQVAKQHLDATVEKGEQEFRVARYLPLPPSTFGPFGMV